MRSAIDLVASQPWAIEEKWLGTIIEIANRTNGDLDAVETKLGRPLDNSRTVTVRDGVAIIPIAGPLFRYANLFTALSGATSVNVLARDFTQALEDPEIKAILLEVDSPGGQVNGINELADMIFAARQAGTKPIAAYVSNMAASGAYWLASAADEIVVDETAQLGSIGVVLGIRDSTGRDKAEGIETIEIVSSNAPKKRIDHKTKDGRETLLAQVDALARVFSEKVARHRGVALDVVNSDFGQGGILIGQAAVDAGLANRLGSFESVLAELAGHSQAGITAANIGDPQMTDQAKAAPTAAKTETATPVAPEPVAAVQVGPSDADAARLRAEGAALERDRIAGLEASSLPGFEALLAECKADGKSTDADLALKIVALQKQQGSDALAATKAADKKLAVLPSAAASQTGQVAAPVVDADDPESVKAAAERQWDADANLRKEFRGKKDAYLAYAQAEAGGSIRRYGKAS